MQKLAEEQELILAAFMQETGSRAPEIFPLFPKELIEERFRLLLAAVSEILAGKDFRVLLLEEGAKEIQDLGRHGADYRFPMEILLKVCFLFREVLWKYLENRCDLIRHGPPGKLLSTIRQVTDYLSNTYLAIVQEYLKEERELVAMHQAALAKKQMELEADLDLARNIQQSISPNQCECGLVKGCAMFLPSRQVGGDFYDLIHYKEPAPRVDVFIGDVRGKGVSAALLTMMIMSLLWEVGKIETSPKRILEMVNRDFRDRIREDLQYFASLFYLSYDPARSRLTYCKAGHEDGLLLRRGSKIPEHLTSEGYFLGLFDDGNFEEISISVESGDKVLLFTDGVLALKNGAGERFVYETLFDTFSECGDCPPDVILERITAVLQAHLGGREPADDVALVVLEL
ncbi:MAG: PP2C family protein-serine/threonine phosphatase [Armatimonadetes bacterium]|nr:PP2C family protein-serine/threonine phosphatase [Armatimonadota bacterium]